MALIDKLNEVEFSSFNPSNYSYQEYFNIVYELNRFAHELVKLDLQKNYQNCANSLIVTVGSDARCEKSFANRDGSKFDSPIEVMVVARTSDELNDAIARLNDYLKKTSFERLFIPINDIETKLMTQKIISESYFDQGNKKYSFMSPNRILDSDLLSENGELYLDLKDRLFNEILSPIAHKILKEARRKINYHAKVTKDGYADFKKETVKHFDFDTGEVIYEPSSYQLSFKQGPLRLVQNSIVRDVIKYMRKHKAKELLDLPQNTAYKIRRIQDIGISSLSQSELDSLIDSYMFFLWAYHNSQHNFKQGNRITVLDPKEIKDRCSQLDEICSKGLFKVEE